MLDTVVEFIATITDKPFLTFYSEYIINTLDDLVDLEAKRLEKISNIHDIDIAINSLLEEVSIK